MEILNFLLPIHLSPFKIDFLPLIFFIVIWGLFIFTIVQVYRKAKPKNWEHNWYGGNKKDKGKKLDAEHGSVMEISHAVATSSERVADIMPGMILIIGLLGTFLGLGLALDKASGILTGANAMSNMDASMSQLMEMLQGLGTKFKTSTWGLMAFILLKVVLSKNGYEESRLRWSIEKVKSELDLTRDKQVEEQRQNNQRIIDSMQNIAIQFEKNLQQNQVMNQQQLKQLSQFTQDTTLAIQTSHEEQAKLLNMVQQNQIDNISVIKYNMQTIARQFEKILTGLSEKYDSMLKGLDVQHKENKSFLQDLVQQGKDTRDAMVGFVEKNDATVSSLGKSATGMSKAASTMGTSATHLQGVIDSFRTNMESLVNLMKKDLNSTITGMNDSFSKNMSSMSKGLNTATADISNAVNSLSSSVDKTMTEVTTTINESMALQTKAQTVFIESTDTLNEYVNEMTSLVNKLSGDITGGLKAVSDSNRNMISLSKKTDNILEVFNDSFKESLQSIESVTTLKPALENLTQGIDLQTGLLNQIATNTASNQQKKSNTFPKLSGRK